jgi:hypothetical protein
MFKAAQSEARMGSGFVPNENSIIFASTSTGVSLSAINGNNATRIRNRTIRRWIQYSEIRLLTP